MIEKLLPLAEYFINRMTPLTGDAILVPDGSKRIPTRQNGEVKLAVITGPDRPVRAHVFTDLSGMAAWVTRESVEPQDVDAIVDSITSEGLIARVTLNTNDAIADIVTARIGLHPLYLQWSRLIGRKLSQKELYAALRPLVDTITDNDGVKVAGAHLGKALLDSLRSFNVEKGVKIEQTLSRHGGVELSARGDKAAVSVTLPEVLTVTVPILKPLEAGGEARAYDITVYLAIDLSGDEPSFTLSWPSIDLTLTSAADDATDQLRMLLGADFLVCAGTLNRRIVTPGL